MHGTLDTFSVVEVLQMLGRVRRSGTLHIECPERQIDVHFVQGQIAETRDSTRVYADTVLGSLLRPCASRRPTLVRSAPSSPSAAS
jgi:hypothetical protein